MNENMVVSAIGMDLIASFEGKPRLIARLCEGGRYELSYGCTTWPDARPVAKGETCTEDQALMLFAFHLHRFEAVVKRHVKVQLNQFQFDAHVALAYNVGEEQYKDSTVLREANKSNWDAMAAAFCRFIYATKTPAQRDPAKEPLEWYLAPQEYGPQEYGPEGEELPRKLLPRKQVSYRRALRGLHRRHLAEGLVSLGLPWEKACDDDAIFMRTERVWKEKLGLNEDRVVACSEWQTVRQVAMEDGRLELPEHPVVASDHDQPFDLDAWEAKEREYLAALPIDVQIEEIAPLVQVDEFVVAAPTPAPPPKPAPTPLPAPPAAQKTAPAPPRLPPALPQGPAPAPPGHAKQEEATRRFWALFLYYGGKIFMVVGVSTLPGKFAVYFGEAWGAVVKDPQLFGMAIDALVFTSGWAADTAGSLLKRWDERKKAKQHPPAVVAQVSTQTAVVHTQTTAVATVGAT